MGLPADERFEVAGEDMERHMSISYEQPERLREAAPAPVAGPLFSRAESFGPSTPFDAPGGVPYLSVTYF
jgi:hypothetical protein